MMSFARYIARGELARALDDMARGRVTYAPRREGDAVVFRPRAEGEEPLLARATVPPKGVIFPQSERLFAFIREKDPNDPGHTTVRLDSTVDIQPALIFGARPCDARGFHIFDRVYLNGPHRDPYYAARREATVVVTLACTKAGSTCFCHWTGCGPADTTGSDILLTPVGEGADAGFVAVAVTERGGAVLEAANLPEADAARSDAAQAVHAATQAALDAQSPAPDLSATPARLLERFSDNDFWRDMSDKCLSCGACTYLCPTCYCFNITDENDGGDGMRGRRLRSWDNCMSSLFTREASGHNPRMGKALRLRNRVGHKFSYYPQLHEGVVSCNGCGRCITGCPVSVDIREMVVRATEANEETPNA